MTDGSWEGAGGHGGIPLRITNSSARSCTLTGYPGVAVLDSSGRQMLQAGRTPRGYLGGLSFSNGTIPVVNLGPGQTAAALMEWRGNPEAPQQTTCASYGAILVTPPNLYRSTELQASVTYLCGDLEVHPVLPGTTGAQWNEG